MQMATSLRKTTVLCAEYRRASSSKGCNARFLSLARLKIRSPSLGLTSLDWKKYSVPRASISGRIASRTSLVPSLLFPSTIDSAQISGPKKRIVSTMLPRSRGNSSTTCVRSRAKKYLMEPKSVVAVVVVSSEWDFRAS